jgi:hypothetical protein
MDAHEICDHTNEETPILILDRHHSQMDIEFLEYVNQLEHKWYVCLGVPYRTHKWQVADSSKVNAQLKTKLGKAKSDYLLLKNNNQSLKVTSIIPVIISAFATLFANVKNSKTQKAIFNCGWGAALNYHLLLDKSLSLY